MPSAPHVMPTLLSKRLIAMLLADGAKTRTTHVLSLAVLLNVLWQSWESNHGLHALPVGITIGLFNHRIVFREHSHDGAPPMLQRKNHMVSCGFSPENGESAAITSQGIPWDPWDPGLCRKGQQGMHQQFAAHFGQMSRHCLACLAWPRCWNDYHHRTICFVLPFQWANSMCICISIYHISVMVMKMKTTTTTTTPPATTTTMMMMMMMLLLLLLLLTVVMVTLLLLDMEQIDFQGGSPTSNSYGNCNTKMWRRWSPRRVCLSTGYERYVDPVLNGDCWRNRCHGLDMHWKWLKVCTVYIQVISSVQGFNHFEPPLAIHRIGRGGTISLHQIHSLDLPRLHRLHRLQPLKNSQVHIWREGHQKQYDVSSRVTGKVNPQHFKKGN